MKELLNNKKLLGIYTLWITLHFIIFVFSSNGSKHEFWPLTDYSLMDSYDITEFLIYSICPILLIIAINLISSSKDENKH
jgi:hypothetical protein